MSEGAHGDLFPVRFYRQDTPVNSTEANEPLADLQANILVIDGKFAEHLANHPAGTGGTVTPTTVTLSREYSQFLTPTGLTAPASGTVGTDLDAQIFANGVDEALKLEFTVPENYQSGDGEFWVHYTMSASNSGTVDVVVDGEISRVDGTSSTFGPTTENLTVNSGTLPGEVLLFTLPAGTWGVGDRIRLTWERQGSTDPNAADWQITAIGFHYTGSSVLGGGGGGGGGGLDPTTSFNNGEGTALLQGEIVAPSTVAADTCLRGDATLDNNLSLVIGFVEPVGGIPSATAGNINTVRGINLPARFDASLSLALGDKVFLSETAGRVTNVAPTAVGTVRQQVGYITSLLSYDGTTDFLAQIMFADGPRIIN